MGWGGLGVAWRGKVWYGMKGYHLNILPLPFFCFQIFVNYQLYSNFKLLNANTFLLVEDSRLAAESLQ